MIIRILLAPFALLYGAAVKVRNLLFDYQVIKSVGINKPTICVGNITVGGTGKTPHVEYLVRLLTKNHKVAVLSRGYKRKTQGFAYADINSTPCDVGDEPLQIKLKHPNTIVAVDGDRVKGVNRIVKDHPEVDAVVLDDAFQHRYIKPGYSILLVDYNNPIGKDYFLPTGTLRDSFSERRRANSVIVTKCPAGITHEEQETIRKELKLEPHLPVFFSHFKYGKPTPVFSGDIIPFSLSKDMKVIAIAGIANPDPFFRFLENRVSEVHKMVFADHFAYSEKKIRAIFEIFKSIQYQHKAIVTTEKDAVKIKNLKGLDESIRKSMFYIPIEVEFIERSGTDFNLKIETYVRENQRNSNLY